MHALCVFILFNPGIECAKVNFEGANHSKSDREEAAGKSASAVLII
jgi:hypothetical protein